MCVVSVHACQCDRSHSKNVKVFSPGVSATVLGMLHGCVRHHWQVNLGYICRPFDTLSLFLHLASHDQGLTSRQVCSLLALMA